MLQLRLLHKPASACRHAESHIAGLQICLEQLWGSIACASLLLIVRHAIYLLYVDG